MMGQKKYIIACCVIASLIFLIHYQSFGNKGHPPVQIQKKVVKIPGKHHQFDRWKRLLANRTYTYSQTVVFEPKLQPKSRTYEKSPNMPLHISLQVGNSSINSSHINRTCFYFENGNAYKPVPWDKDTLRDLHCSRRLPDAVIFGTRQGGTSKLGFYLRTHPDIAFSEREEMHFFGSPKERRGIDWYRSQMMQSRANQTTMESTPKYFVRPLVAKQLYEVLGATTKLLLVIQDPVKRAMFDFIQLQEVWHDKGTELMDRWAYFNGTLDDYYFLLNSSFETTVLKSSGEVRKENAIVYLGCYSFFLKRWLKYFPVSQIHIINLDDLQYDPIKTLNRVEKFLHISHYFDEDKLHYDSSKKLHCLTSPFNHCADENQGRVLPQVDEAVIQKLRDYYRSFNSELCQLVPQTCNFSWIQIPQ